MSKITLNGPDAYEPRELGKKRAAMMSRGEHKALRASPLDRSPCCQASGPEVQTQSPSDRKKSQVVLRHPQAYSGLYAHVHTYIGLILNSVLKEVQLDRWLSDEEHWLLLQKSQV